MHLRCDFICGYCGKKADKIINGFAFEYNPIYEVKNLIELEKKQFGKRKSIFDIKIYVSFEVDHILPEFSGGKTEISNLILSCRSCNRSKGYGLV